MSRTLRQTKILELISQKDITTQEELVSELKALNFDANQSTISRDIKELGLVRVMLDSGKFKYVYMDLEKEGQRVMTKLFNIFREAVLKIDSSENLIVVKTLSGCANSVAVSIDKMCLDGIIGSVAGDDTVLLVAKTKSAVEDIIESLNNVLKQDM